MIVVAALLLSVGAWFAWSLRGDTGADAYSQALRPFLQSAGAVSPARRVLLIGWDGATFNMIDPLVRAGRLPNLRRMMDAGAALALESTIIPISSAAWSGAVTGMGPGKSGVFGFFDPVPDSYEIALISSHTRRAPALWHILNEHGKRTHVVGMPVTYPPDRLDGVMFGCMLTPFEVDYAHPSGLAAALRGLEFLPDLDAWRNPQEFSLEQVQRQHEIKTRVVTTILRDSAWDFSMIVYKSLDVLCHRLYDGQTDGVIADHYALLDDALGQIRAAAGANTDVLLMSDHGFGTFTHFLSLNGLLVELGLAVRRPDAPPPDAGDDTSFGELLASRHSDDMKQLDLGRSLAYAGATEANFASVRLNLRGREPQGIVPPEQRAAVLAQVMEKLRSARSRIDGKPLCTQVLALTDLYAGPLAGEMPDILLELDRRYICKPWFRQPAQLPFRARPSPDHERDGVLIAAGPSIARSSSRGRASVLDIAPTVLALFDLPGLRDMDGRAIAAILKRAPPPPTDDAGRYARRLAESRVALDESAMRADVERRMNAIGYAGASAPQSSGATTTQPASRRTPQTAPGSRPGTQPGAASETREESRP